MARRTELVTIEGDPKENRDAGKTFLLTEMSATDAEAWAIKALLALIQAGVEIPDETAGMAALAVAGLKALNHLDYATVKPLLDDMFTCVQYQHRPGHAPQEADPNIEEVSTRLTLRKRLFQLHVGFSKAAATPTTAPR